jgi:hypothetical protein
MPKIQHRGATFRCHADDPIRMVPIPYNIITIDLCIQSYEILLQRDHDFSEYYRETNDYIQSLEERLAEANRSNQALREDLRDVQEQLDDALCNSADVDSDAEF